jgi:hypothetical protein
MTDITSNIADLLYIYTYAIVCGALLPTPIEAPMFLYPNLSRIAVLCACSLGKGTGSYLVFKSGAMFRRTVIFDWLTGLPLFSIVWSWLSSISDRLIQSYGWIGFVVCQATPGLPMRSAVFAVSVMEVHAFRFAIGSAIGTCLRCLIVYYLITTSVDFLS